MANAIRWGVLGTGTMASRFAQDLRQVPQARLAAVASRDRGRAQQFAATFGIPRAYAEYAELVADREIDVVYVATPNYAHKEHSLLALSAGKPVLCEKPFTINAAEAREVVTLARRQHLFCMEAIRRWLRQTPPFRAIYHRCDEVLGAMLQRGAKHFVASFRGNGYNCEAAEVMRCLCAGEVESPLMPLDETVSIMVTVDAIRQNWQCQIS